MKEVKVENGSSSSGHPSVWSDVGQPRPRASGHPRSLTGIEPNIHQQDAVTVPRERLLMLQLSLQRAEHAVSHSLQLFVERAQQLKSEMLSVQHASGVINDIIFSGR